MRRTSHRANRTHRRWSRRRPSPGPALQRSAAAAGPRRYGLGAPLPSMPTPAAPRGPAVQRSVDESVVRPPPATAAAAPAPVEPAATVTPDPPAPAAPSAMPLAATPNVQRHEDRTTRTRTTGRARGRPLAGAHARPGAGTGPSPPAPSQQAEPQKDLPPVQRTVEDALEPDVPPMTRPLLGAEPPVPTSTPVARTPVRATGLLPTVSRSVAPDAPSGSTGRGVLQRLLDVARPRAVRTDAPASGPAAEDAPVQRSSDGEGSRQARPPEPSAAPSAGPAMNLAVPVVQRAVDGEESRPAPPAEASAGPSVGHPERARAARCSGRSSGSGLDKLDHPQRSSTTRRAGSTTRRAGSTSRRLGRTLRARARAARAARTRRRGSRPSSTTRRATGSAGPSVREPAPLVQRALVGEWSRQARPPAEPARPLVRSLRPETVPAGSELERTGGAARARRGLVSTGSTTRRPGSTTRRPSSTTRDQARPPGDPARPLGNGDRQRTGPPRWCSVRSPDGPPSSTCRWRGLPTRGPGRPSRQHRRCRRPTSPPHRSPCRGRWTR